MKYMDRFQIRKDLNEITEALQTERFLKDSDPSVSVMHFIEAISNEMGVIKHIYAKGAHDRNQIVEPIKAHLTAMRQAIDAVEQDLDASKDDPEDVNDTLPSDKEN